MPNHPIVKKRVTNVQTELKRRIAALNALVPSELRPMAFGRQRGSGVIDDNNYAEADTGDDNGMATRLVVARLMAATAGRLLATCLVAVTPAAGVESGGFHSRLTYCRRLLLCLALMYSQLGGGSLWA
jgi:hypothetical protein